MLIMTMSLKMNSQGQKNKTMYKKQKTTECNLETFFSEVLTLFTEMEKTASW